MDFFGYLKLPSKYFLRKLKIFSFFKNFNSTHTIEMCVWNFLKI